MVPKVPGCTRVGVQSCIFTAVSVETLRHPAVRPICVSHVQKLLTGSCKHPAAQHHAQRTTSGLQA